MSGSRRVWERRIEPGADGVHEIPLRFRVVPGTWPDIIIAPADGTSADVTAREHELRLVCATGEHGTVLVDVAGHLVAVVGRTVTTAQDVFVVPGLLPIGLTMVLRDDGASLVIDGCEPRDLFKQDAASETAVNAVTENVAAFTVPSARPTTGTVRLGGEAAMLSGTVWGLREPESRLYRTARGPLLSSGDLFYSSDEFDVTAHRVSERDHTDPPALVPDRTSIVSPIRVTEEFAWRDNPYGDMVRVTDRAELWRSRIEPNRFAELTTRFPSVDAAFLLAMETFQRNSSGEFSLPRQEGLWSAGYFQGSGQGFGVWKRDTAHIALRCGNLLDPDVARASLSHIVNAGFDNGSDGDTLPAVAIWDHALATGDESLVDETWEGLVGAVQALDARFDPMRGLIAAPQSTSNDLFDEPEAGGFALSTEVYAMQTYAAMARMGALAAIADPRVEQWSARASGLRSVIIEQYWSAGHGFFTSGPAGSESFERGYWETSGAEAALWGFLGAEAESMTASALRALRTVAMSEYGVVLFPYRDDDNHFCHSVWYGWQAGIARAAARVGDAPLIHRLIAQQVRTVVRNKTFYEVTDARTGHSWRWPGQLWHAAGFASLVLYGVFGIAYDELGMAFTPAVAPEFDGTRLEGLRYRGARLDIEIRGHGTSCSVTMDGHAIDRVPPDIVGRHSVVLAMR
ncbi:MAG: hypothetical protein AB7K08_15230 [Microbacteriaceae bacterium]